MRIHSLLFIIGTAGLVACGGRSIHFDPDAGGGGSDGGGTGPDASLECGADDPCVVAIRTDNCCESPYPERWSAVMADPCLELWPPWGRTSEACRARWPEECQSIGCSPPVVPSRLAVCNDGTCEYTQECSDHDGCALAINHAVCCPCPTSVPVALIDLDPCLTRYGTSESPAASCPLPPCDLALCELCWEPAPWCDGQTNICIDVDDTLWP